MAIFEAMGASIYYESVGEGKPVVLLHGLSSSQRVMVDLFEPIFAHTDGWQRIYVDIPGMGQSRAGDRVQSSDDILAVLLALVDAVIPDAPFALIGFSYGAYLAQGIAHRRPAQMLGLTLLCPVVQAAPSDRILPPQAVFYRDPAVMAMMSETERRDLDMMAANQIRAVFDGIQNTMAPSGATTDADFVMRLRERYSFSFDVSAPEPVIPCPTLIIAGRQDIVTGYQQALGLGVRYPRASLVALDGAAHLAPYERGPVLDALTRDWLSRVETFTP